MNKCSVFFGGAGLGGPGWVAIGGVRRTLSSAPEALPLGPHLLHLGPKTKWRPASVVESRSVILESAGLRRPT
jgi:hypothetical protein